MHLAQRIKRCAIHSVALVRDEMTLVDENEMPMSEQFWRAEYRLNRRKYDLLIPISATESRTVNPERRVGPKREQVLDVLLDQLLYVYQHEHAHVRISLDCVTYQPRDK